MITKEQIEQALNDVRRVGSDPEQAEVSLEVWEKMLWKFTRQETLKEVIKFLNTIDDGVSTGWHIDLIIQHFGVKDD